MSLDQKLALAAGAVVALGSIGPWVDIGGVFTKNGLQGDGFLTLLLAIGACACLAFIAKRATGALVGGILYCVAALIVLVDLANANSKVSELNDALGTEVSLTDVLGWGIWIVLIGSIAGAVFMFRSRRAQPA